jgi:hypothetical protein
MKTSLISEFHLLPSSPWLSTRRQFLNRLGRFGFASFFSVNHLLFPRAIRVVAAVQKPAASITGLGNRSTLAPSAFTFLPLGSIRPRGGF